MAETLARLPARADAEGYVGDSPDWFGPTLFGGFVLGQATSAISQAAPDDFVIHSLHLYFLSAMRAGVDARYAVDTLRDGRSFAHRSLVGSQDGKPFVSMTASFTAPDRPSDFEYGRPMDPSVPGPDELEINSGDDPWDGAWLGPSEPDGDGFYPSTMRRWIRFARPLPDDPHLHGALLAYASDMTGIGARPLQLSEEYGIEGIVSLDHAVHFHRPVRVDQWLFYDVASMINTGGRGVLRGQIHTEDGTHVASVTQETLLWDPTKG